MSGHSVCPNCPSVGLPDTAGLSQYHPNVRCLVIQIQIFRRPPIENIGHSDCQTVLCQEILTVPTSECLTLGQSDCPTVRHWDSWTVRQSDSQSVQHWDSRTVGLSHTPTVRQSFPMSIGRPNCLNVGQFNEAMFVVKSTGSEWAGFDGRRWPRTEKKGRRRTICGCRYLVGHFDMPTNTDIWPCWGAMIVADGGVPASISFDRFHLAQLKLAMREER
jgi:hypothetical protein